MFIELNWMNSGITSASSGTICTTSTSTRTVVRKGNWNRDTATAASSASSPLITTVPSPTSSEFFRNVVNPPSPSTYWKFSSEKSVGSRARDPSLAWASKAVDSITSTGNRLKTSTAAKPMPFTTAPLRRRLGLRARTDPTAASVTAPPAGTTSVDRPP